MDQEKDKWPHISIESSGVNCECRLDLVIDLVMGVSSFYSVCVGQLKEGKGFIWIDGNLNMRYRGGVFPQHSIIDHLSTSMESMKLPLNIGMEKK